MFGISSTENLPTAFRENEIWDNYIGSVWWKILNFYGIKKNATVIEIAPGSSTKIAKCLSYMDFSGKLYIVEQSMDICKILKPKYQAHLPKAEIVIINKPLILSLNSLPQQADFILSNSPLDDMLISKLSLSGQTFDWAKEYTSNVSTLLSDVWENERSDYKKLNVIKNNIRDEWTELFQKIQPSKTLISQYPSSILHDNNMDDLNNHGIEILKMIAKAFSNIVDNANIQSLLNLNNNYNNFHIGMEVLNSDYWLNMNFKKQAT